MTTPVPGSPVLSAVVVGAPDVALLAAFYRQLLGWEVVEDEPEWVRLAPPGGGTGLSVQLEPDHVLPVWPAGQGDGGDGGDQQMMLHLDLRVTDLDAAGAHASACGATLAEHQPQEDVRVWLDPAGHPFCFFLAGA